MTTTRRIGDAAAPPAASTLPAPAPRDSARPPSLPAPLARLTDDAHRPRRTVGSVPAGWLPPPRLERAVAALLPDAIADHQRALVPAGRQQIRAALSRLALSCRLEDMPARAWETHLSDFIADLAETPPDIIDDTCRRWRRGHKFWPTICEFLALSEPALYRRRRVLERLKALARVAETPAPGNAVDRDWYFAVVVGGAPRATSGVTARGAGKGAAARRIGPRPSPDRRPGVDGPDDDPNGGATA